MYKLKHTLINQNLMLLEWCKIFKREFFIFIEIGNKCLCENLIAKYKILLKGSNPQKKNKLVD